MSEPDKAKPAGETIAPKDGETPAADGAGEGQAVPEIGGRKGPDPTRFGDWEKDGRCIDF